MIHIVNINNRGLSLSRLRATRRTGSALDILSGMDSRTNRKKRLTGGLRYKPESGRTAETKSLIQYREKRLVHFAL